MFFWSLIFSPSSRFTSCLSVKRGQHSLHLQKKVIFHLNGRDRKANISVYRRWQGAFQKRISSGIVFTGGREVNSLVAKLAVRFVMHHNSTTFVIFQSVFWKFLVEEDFRRKNGNQRSWKLVAEHFGGRQFYFDFFSFLSFFFFFF